MEGAQELSSGVAHWLPRDLSPVWLWLYVWLFLEKRFAVSPRSAPAPPTVRSVLDTGNTKRTLEYYRPFSSLCVMPPQPLLRGGN